MKKSIFLAICFLVFPLFAENNNSIRVQNGSNVPADHDLTRSIARLSLSGGGTCSGSFLTSTVLVTASHCTYNAAAKTSFAHLRDEDGAWHTVSISKLITHPQFSLKENSTGTFVKNDIALVILAEEFPFSVRPMKIASIEDMRDNRTTVTVAGYGLSSPKGGSGKLRSGQMTATIEDIYQFHQREGIYMVEKNDQAVCPGDSGGAVIKGKDTSTLLIGVNSLSSACQSGVTAAASMSEIVANYKSWIKKQAPGVP